MLRNATIAPSRAWSTWSNRPAEIVFLPLGVRLTPVAYAGSTGRATLFPAGAELVFGRHDLDSSEVGIELKHAGTVLDWRYAKAEPFVFAGGWQAKQLGEWGLRFWVNLCLSAADGANVRYDSASGAAVVKVGSRFVALVSADQPVQVTGHATVEALAADYEANGYFHLGSQSSEAPVLALRFNLEMTRAGAFAAAVADRADLAIDKARAALQQPVALPPAHTGRFAGALDAVRDVMGWNTVWDEANARAYTSISRNWNQSKFGGFGVWLNDQHYAALMTGLLDPDIGRENLMATLASATPQGNFACLVTANDAWVDRTQLPVASFLVWLMFLRSGSRPLLQLMADSLARNHAWWWANRDPHGRGLVSYGTSDVGEGLYKGTSFGARNESSMDNAPIHDEARYDPQTRTLDCMDVGLNSLLALDAEMLALIAAELGDMAGAKAHAARAEATRETIRTVLWDESRGIFANRLWSGAFVRSLGPTSFYPLVASVPTCRQAESLLRHLANPVTFGGSVVLPGVTRDDPTFADNVYWRGRVWPPLNYWVWQGLRRAGRPGEASVLATRSFDLFDRAWTKRLCPENYNATTGEPLDQPDTEGFYGWGALMPLMAVGEITDVTPWQGWSLTNTGEDVSLGPIQSPVGLVTVKIAGGRLTLMRGTEPIFGTSLIGTMTHLEIQHGALAFVLPDAVAEGADVAIPGVSPSRVSSASVAGADVSIQSAGTDATIGLRPDMAGRRLQISWTVAV